MFEWFTEFMESPLGKLISTGILAVAVLLLTLAAAGLVNRLMKKLVDRHRKTNSSIATVLGFVRYIAVAAVYFAGGMVIVGAIPVLSSAVRTLLATGGVIAVVAGLAAQEALGSVVSGVMILAFKPFKMGDVVLNADQYASEEASYKQWVQERDSGAENAAKETEDDTAKQLASYSFKQSYTKTHCYKLLDLMN